jgi:hypothetical protein
MSGVTLLVSDFTLRQITKLPTNTTIKSKKIHSILANVQTRSPQP